MFLITLNLSSNSVTKLFIKNSFSIEAINIPNLIKDLLEADKKLTPKKVNNEDGSYFFLYKKSFLHLQVVFFL